MTDKERRKELAWHFTNGMKLRDGTRFAEGDVFRFEGDVAMCRSGYHWSRDPLDALHHAPGWTLSRVWVDEIVEEQEDKGVSRVRGVIETHDVRDIILLWASDVLEHAIRKYYTGQSDAPQRAIDTARAFVRGEATADDCYAAAYAVNAASHVVAGAAADVAYGAYAVNAASHVVAYAVNAAVNVASHVVAGAVNAAVNVAVRRLLRIRLSEVFVKENV